MVISLEAAPVDKAIFLDYLTSEVALEEPEIRCTDQNIPIDNITRITKCISGSQGADEVTKM